MPLGAGTTDFTLDGAAPVAAIRCITGRRGRSRRWRDGEVAWRFISHLSLNYLSLLDTDAAPGRGGAARAARAVRAPATSPAVDASRSRACARCACAPIVRRLPVPRPDRVRARPRDRRSTSTNSASRAAARSCSARARAVLRAPRLDQLRSPRPCCASASARRDHAMAAAMRRTRPIAAEPCLRRAAAKPAAVPLRLLPGAAPPRVRCIPTLPRLGAALRPADEPVRLGQEPSLTFAPAALIARSSRRARRRRAAAAGALLRPARPERPAAAAPDRVRARARCCTTATRRFARFLDMFHHRFLALFYRAWAQAQPTVSLDRPRDDRFALLRRRAGRARRRQRCASATPSHDCRQAVLRRPAGAPGAQRRRAGARCCAGYFRVPVEVEQFVGHWMTLPEADRSRLGARRRRALGRRRACSARRVWDRQHKFRIALGPLDAGAVRALPARRARAAPSWSRWCASTSASSSTGTCSWCCKRDEVPRAAAGPLRPARLDHAGSADAAQARRRRPT